LLIRCVDISLRVIKAFYSRIMVYKDDSGENKVTKTFNYYVVEKMMAGSQDRIYEIMGEELCGGSEVQAALNKSTVPMLTEKTALEDLPSKKVITKISWGLNWVAARRKYKDKKGIPVLVVSLWWVEETDGLRPEFKKGVETGKPRERCAVLARGHYGQYLGPRGDRMIMKCIPHPEGYAWANVKECISFYVQNVDS
jgi:hypothetical protein